MTLRSASLTEMDWSPTRSRLPVKDMPAPNHPRLQDQKTSEHKQPHVLVTYFQRAHTLLIIGPKSKPGLICRTRGTGTLQGAWRLGVIAEPVRPAHAVRLGVRSEAHRDRDVWAFHELPEAAQGQDFGQGPLFRL